MNHPLTLLLVATATLGAAITGPDITATERDTALQYLGETRDGLLSSVKLLSDAQLKFKPAPDRWSIAEIVEHITLIENTVDDIVGKQLAQGAAAKPDRVAKETDAMLLAKVPDRTTKVKAPGFATPANRWSWPETQQHFLTARAETISLLRSTGNLRGHTVNHPVFGPLDGYQWILAAAGHCERHTKQIMEVKADPNFPVQ